jgi:hypothetical protein
VRYDADWRDYRPGARYDRGYSPPRARYDRGYSQRRDREPGWPSHWAREPEWDQDGWAGLERDVDHDTRGLQGPARYGLGPYHERLRRRRRSDDDLRQDVEDALFYDTWVDADAITVEVEDGVVTLHGVLPSYDEIRFATDDAWDIDGVIGVRTELRVSEG